MWTIVRAESEGVDDSQGRARVWAIVRAEGEVWTIVRAESEGVGDSQGRERGCGR